jgi:hypothetical protein
VVALAEDMPEDEALSPQSKPEGPAHLQILEKLEELELAAEASARAQVEDDFIFTVTGYQVHLTRESRLPDAVQLPNLD